MTGRMTHKISRLLRLAIMPLLITACTREVLWHGFEVVKVDDGEAIKVSALMPLCGCIGLVNTSNQEVTLRAIFDAEIIGSVVLKPKDQTTEHFDWGGPENSDFYIIEAFDKAGNRLPIRGNIRFANSVENLNCKTTQCRRVLLGMNRGERIVGGEAIDTRIFHGVQYGNEGNVIQLASTRDECGCMSLTNATFKPVRLTATLHKEPVGEMIIQPMVTERIRYDWAGPADSDVYVLEATDPGTNQALPMLKTIRIAGFSEKQSCTRAPCEFGSLKLHSAVGAEIR